MTGALTCTGGLATAAACLCHCGCSSTRARTGPIPSSRAATMPSSSGYRPQTPRCSCWCPGRGGWGRLETSIYVHDIPLTYYTPLSMHPASFAAPSGGTALLSSLKGILAPARKMGKGAHGCFYGCFFGDRGSRRKMLPNSVSQFSCGTVLSVIASPPSTLQSS